MVNFVVACGDHNVTIIWWSSCNAIMCKLCVDTHMPTYDDHHLEHTDGLFQDV